MIGFDLNVIGRPPTSVEDDDFTLLVKDGNVHRQEQEQREDTGLLRASCERYLKDLYEPLPEPISRELGRPLCISGENLHRLVQTSEHFRHPD